jgi:biotin carboxyl carrier protein
MPGKIIQVLVQEGDEVEAGDTLVLMEAMKMEHNLKAANKGRVSKVTVVAGDLVADSQELVRVE